MKAIIYNAFEDYLFIYYLNKLKKRLERFYETEYSLFPTNFRMQLTFYFFNQEKRLKPKNCFKEVKNK